MRKNLVLPVILIVLTAALYLIAAVPVFGNSGFSVAPNNLQVEIPLNQDGAARVYLTSDFTGELELGTERMPFTISPGKVRVNSTDQKREVVLNLQRTGEPEPGAYRGKLTFLARGEGNVAYGVKIAVTVNYADKELKGEVAFIDEEDLKSKLLKYYPVAGGIILIGLTLGIGIMLGKRMRR